MQVSDRGSGSTPSPEEALRARVAELEARLTRQEAAMAALQQTHQAMEAVVEQADVLFLTVDREWRCTRINTHAATFFGQPSEQLLQQMLWEACPHLLGTVWEHQFRQAMTEQVPVRFEAPSVRDRRWYDVAVHPSPQGLSVHAVETTERRQQDALLRLQAQMLDEIQDAVIAVDDEERVVYLNPAAAAQYEVEPAEALGHRLGELYQYEWLTPEAEAQAYAALAQMGQWRGENLHIKRSGRTLRVESSVSRWHDAQGRPAGMVAVIRDITAYRQTVRALRRERELLEKLFDRLPVLLTMFDPATRVSRFNHAFEQTFGWTEADAAQIDLMEKFYPDPAYRAEVAAYMQAARVEWREFDVTSKTGEVVPSAWSNIRLSDDTLVGIGLDLRERRRQEAALQAASARTERILSSISDSFAVLDRDGTYRYVNDRAAEIACMAKEEMIGRRVWDLFPATWGSEFERQTRQAWEEQRPVRFEYYSPDLDCWLELR